MKAVLRRVLMNIMAYRVAYLIAMFLLLASITCGLRTGKNIEDSAATQIVFNCGFWRITTILLRECVCVLGLLAGSLHPFGCALAAALIVHRGFTTGLICTWWCLRFEWNGILPFVLTILPASLLSIGTTMWGSCVVGSGTLCAQFQDRRALPRQIIIMLLLQSTCVVLRCIGCAWMM